MNSFVLRNQPIAHLAIVSGNSDSDDAFAADDRVHKHKKKNKLKLNSSRSSKIRSKPISEGPSFIKIKVQIMCIFKVFY